MQQHQRRGELVNASAVRCGPSRPGERRERDERDEVDTLGGFVFALAGHVPVRGEILHHSSGLEFEILESDPRRLRLVRIRGLKSSGNEVRRPAAKTGA